MTCGAEPCPIGGSDQGQASHWGGLFMHSVIPWAAVGRVRRLYLRGAIHVGHSREAMPH